MNPIEGLSDELIGGPEVSRERVLSDEEIRGLWHAESQHAPLLRFLLLTGARIGEAQKARWVDVHGDRWHIPVEHSKSRRAHWFALSRQALVVLRGQDESRDLIFGRATDTGVQAYLRRWCEREEIHAGLHAARFEENRSHAHERSRRHAVHRGANSRPPPARV